MLMQIIRNIEGGMVKVAGKCGRHIGAGVSVLAMAIAASHPAAAEDAAPNNRDIVVTAAGYEQKIAKAPASISVLDRTELQEKRFGSLAEALQDVEGVDVGATAGKTGGLNISIRGMPSEYTLVLLDGRRQNAPGSVTPNGFGETSTGFLPPFSAIERIEVVRGPMSTLYGSDAMGGVVNIITRKVGERWAGTVSAESTVQEHGDFGNIRSANGYVQGPLVKGLIGLSLRGSAYRREAAALKYEDVGGQQIPITAFGRSPTRSEIYTYGGRVSMTPHADHDLWVEYDRSEQSYDNSRGQMGTNSVQGGYRPELRFNRDNYALAHTWRAGIGVIETTLTRNVTETIGRTVPPNTPGVAAGSPRTLKATNSIIDSRFVGQAGPVSYTVGGQYWHARMVDAVAPAPYKFEQWAGFAEATWTIVDGFNLTGGARYDDHSTFGGKWSPRVYAVWNLNDALTMKGGVSRGFKTPQLNQIAQGIVGFGNQGRLPLIGSPGLKPETSATYEAGIYYDDGGVFSGNITFFNNEFTDKIASGPDIANCQFAANPNRPGCIDVGPFPGVEWFGQSINIDKAVTRGGEVAARFALTEAVTLGVNYTYTESEQKSGADKGLPLIGTPKHMLNGNVRWKIDAVASLWARAEIRSSRYRGAGAAQDALGNYKGYELFHLGGALQITDQFRLAATIFNVLDTNYVEYLPHPSGATTTYSSEYSNNQEGRRLWISATVDF
nr:TonB-dependent receptor [Sphingomonas sp. KC8]